MGKIFGIWIFSAEKMLQKLTCGQIIFMYKFWNEIVNKVVFISLKTGQKWNLTFFREAISQFYFR